MKSSEKIVHCLVSFFRTRTLSKALFNRWFEKQVESVHSGRIAGGHRPDDNGVPSESRFGSVDQPGYLKDVDWITVLL